jgi:AraC-like DNA-binding protein
MLRDTTSDIAAIAGLLGYTSASAFVRAFARWEGQPPAAWRKTASTATSVNAHTPGPPDVKGAAARRPTGQPLSFSG